jgi:hypothetical protein
MLIADKLGLLRLHKSTNNSRFPHRCNLHVLFFFFLGIFLVLVLFMAVIVLFTHEGSVLCCCRCVFRFRPKRQNVAT